MKTFYVSFGQIHVHHIGGKVFDKDCLAGIEAEDMAEARQLAFRFFGQEFFTVYDVPDLQFFPRGVINVEENQQPGSQSDLAGH